VEVLQRCRDRLRPNLQVLLTGSAAAPRNCTLQRWSTFTRQRGCLPQIILLNSVAVKGSRLTSSRGCLRMLPRPPVLSIFPKIMFFRSNFLHVCVHIYLNCYLCLSLEQAQVTVQKLAPLKCRLTSVNCKCIPRSYTTVVLHHKSASIHPEQGTVYTSTKPPAATVSSTVNPTTMTVKQSLP
jgi:hypothetical protein